MSSAKSIICFFFEHNLPKPTLTSRVDFEMARSETLLAENPSEASKNALEKIPAM